MSEIAQAVLLGIVQGLTEFLPISSTAHLALVPWALGFDSPLLHSLTFDVALHMGTLLAVLGVFWRDWLQLAAGFGRSVLRPRSVGSDTWARMSWLILIATLPAAAAGLLLEPLVETAFRSPLQIAVVLAGFSIVFVLAERSASQRRTPESLGCLGVLAIGLAQALALVPGVSRSGATISVGLLIGLERAAAARFSFLLSMPVVAGAGLKRLSDARHLAFDTHDVTLMVVGASAAAFSGWLAIRWLLRFLARYSLAAFVWYRVGLAMAVIGIYLARGG